jgi:GntR family transcriptional regulator
MQADGSGASPAGTGGRGTPGGGPGSPIEFRLDAASGVPTYLQLVHQVEHALRLGYLKPGDQLPKVRDVVASLAINPNTVLKAYKELEVKGLAAGRPGQGTFVQATLSQVALPELAGLHKSLLGWLGAADAAGLDQDGIVALFTSALRDFYKRRGGTGDRRGAASARTTAASKAVPTAQPGTGRPARTSPERSAGNGCVVAKPGPGRSRPDRLRAGSGRAS